MKRIYYSPLLHSFLFSIYPVVYLFAGNLKTLQYSVFFLPILVILSICGVIFFILGKFFHSFTKASILTSYIMFFGLSYVNIFGKQEIPIFILIFGGVVLGHVLKKTKRKLTSIVPIFNIASIVLITFPVFDIGRFQLTYINQSGADYRVKHSFEAEKISSKRDIYYFIFDRYAGADTLKEVYGYDNSQFLESLRKKGFYIADKSFANYIATELSLASSLNLVYLDDLIAKVGSDSGDFRPLAQLMEDNAVMRFIKSQGYKYIHLGSWWAPTSLNRLADKNINIVSLSEFSESILTRSIFYPIITSINVEAFNYRYTNWKRLPYQFAELQKIPEDDKPTFVFGHFLLPHPPYVFDKEGNYLSESAENSRDKRTNYTEQLQYTNNQILKLVNSLIEDTGDLKPIIIIQADEGPYPSSYDNNTKTFDWSKATEKERLEKMEIFNAYYLPDGGEKLLYPEITPVNTFRMILNYYFGQNFTLLPDISYFSNKDKPYLFIYTQNNSLQK